MQVRSRKYSGATGATARPDLCLKSRGPDLGRAAQQGNAADGPPARRWPAADCQSVGRARLVPRRPDRKRLPDDGARKHGLVPEAARRGRSRGRRTALGPARSFHLARPV